MLFHFILLEIQVCRLEFLPRVYPPLADSYGGFCSIAAKTRSITACNSVQLANLAALPDTRCSTRPRGTSDSPASGVASCTIKARWAGNRDWCDCDPFTCLSPWQYAMPLSV